jgi:hypothetical protein
LPVELSNVIPKYLETLTRVETDRVHEDFTYGNLHDARRLSHKNSVLVALASPPAI